MTRPLLVAALAALACAALTTSAGAGTTAWTQTTVATGLDSPRALALSPNGDLLVAEGGHGGDVCQPSPFGLSNHPVVHRGKDMAPNAHVIGS